MKRLVRVLSVVFLLGFVPLGLVQAGLPALPALPSLPVLPPLAVPPASAGVVLEGKSTSAAVGAKGSSPVLASRSSVTTMLDTTSAGGDDQEVRGSWFKKRHWLLKAREQQEKINSLVADIQEAGGGLYDTKRANFNQDVATFYEKNAVGRGQIDELLDQLSPYFTQPSQAGPQVVVGKDIAPLSSSRKFQDYFDNTVLFAQLKADLQAIVDIDAGVAERVAQFEKCSQDALTKSAEAQSVVNEMFAMVNHEKARESYYKLEGIAGYLEAILRFVKNDLSSDMDKIIGLGRSRMDEVSKVIVNVRAACEALKKSEAASVDDAAKATAGASKDEVKPLRSDDHVDDISEAPKPALSLFFVIFHFFAKIFYTIIDLIKMLLGKD